MSKSQYHINVCICTFKRRELLLKLLSHLEGQHTNGRFTYSVVVADNDSAKSAEPVVAECTESLRLPIKYCFEPQQNIAMVRNKAIENADGDLIAFIDDDEFPEARWLSNLFESMETFSADGVLGPVKSYYESDPPGWIKAGGFFDRIDHPTGYKLDWSEARTGNVLFKRSILDPLEPPFRTTFGTAGEDVDFFRRMMAKGFSFYWCSEASAYELVPQSRCTGRYLLRRALLRGSNFPKHGGRRIQNAAKSILAIPLYAVALPVLAIFGKHVFIKYLIKLCDHGARLLAHMGLKVVTERET
jgi:glycosyltransferase involved in cell wall biosynthesis